MVSAVVGGAWMEGHLSQSENTYLPKCSGPATSSLGRDFALLPALSKIVQAHSKLSIPISHHWVSGPSLTQEAPEQG